jgi:hypothetical protein
MNRTENLTALWNGATYEQRKQMLGEFPQAEMWANRCWRNLTREVQNFLKEKAQTHKEGVFS